MDGTGETVERLTAEHKTKIMFVQTIKGFALIDLDLADGTPRCLLTVCVCVCSTETPAETRTLVAKHDIYGRESLHSSSMNHPDVM